MFFYGPDKTGKTFLYKILCNKYRSEEKVILCVAFSEIAALLLSKKITSYLRFKILIEINETLYYNFTKQSETGRFLRNTKLII